jgi:hypothetical protein
VLMSFRELLEAAVVCCAGSNAKSIQNR